MLAALSGWQEEESNSPIQRELFFLARRWSEKLQPLLARATLSPRSERSGGPGAIRPKCLPPFQDGKKRNRTVQFNENCSFWPDGGQRNYSRCSLGQRFRQDQKGAAGQGRSALNACRPFRMARRGIEQSNSTRIVLSGQTVVRETTAAARSGNAFAKIRK